MPKNMKHIWSVLCQKSIIDDESNLISLLDCLEQVNFVIDKTKVDHLSKMVFPIDFQIVSFWLVGNITKDKKFAVKIELYDSDGNLVKSYPAEYNIKKDFIRFRSRMKIQGLTITKEGRYFFKIKYKESGEAKFKEAANLPLDVDIKYKLFDVKK